MVLFLQRIGLLCACLAFLTPPVSATDVDGPLVLPPAGSWIVDFAEDRCVVARQFSDGEDAAVLKLSSFLPSDRVTVQVISNTLSARNKAPVVRVLPAGEPATPQMFEKVSAEGGWNGAGFEMLRPETDADATALLIEKTFKQDLQLQTGAIAEVLQVMQTCEDDLAVSLGLDPAQQRNLSQKASIDWDSWDVKTSSLQKKFFQAGSMRQKIRLLVDEEGKVIGCHVIEGAVSQDLDEQMCAAITKDAQFEPALDADAQPVKSYYLHMMSVMRGG